MSETVTALRKAAPYLRLYRGQTFVVKLGGEAVQTREDARRMMEQLGVLQSLGVSVAVVHGGGPQANALAERLGARSEFVNGRRVTDEKMLEAMVLALNGEVRAQLLSVARELGVQAVGLSGIDAQIGCAARRPVGETDYGFVGDLRSVDVGPVRLQLQGGLLPIVSPLCADESGQILNVNADVFAARLAVEMGAAKLIVVTKPLGIYAEVGKPETLISHLDLGELGALAKRGSFKDGMLPKAAAIETALQGGVQRVHVVSFEYRDSLLTEVFTNEGCGTLVVKDEGELWPEESAV